MTSTGARSGAQGLAAAHRGSQRRTGARSGAQGLAEKHPGEGFTGMFECLGQTLSSVAPPGAGARACVRAHLRVRIMQKRTNWKSRESCKNAQTGKSSRHAGPGESRGAQAAKNYFDQRKHHYLTKHVARCCACG